MSEHVFPASQQVEIILIAFQFFQVLFLWLHDWIPLGRLNDVSAVRSQDTMMCLVVVTLIQNVPFTIGLLFSVLRSGTKGRAATAMQSTTIVPLQIAAIGGWYGSA